LAGFGVIVWAIGQVGASTASADTLPGSLTEAYVCNPQLNSQRAVVRATDEGVPQALSGYKPRVTATGSIGQQYTSGVSKAPFAAGQVGAGSPLIGTPNYPRVAAGYTPSSVNVTVNDMVCPHRSMPFASCATNLLVNTSWTP
jgi:hypothetical protein